MLEQQKSMDEKLKARQMHMQQSAAAGARHIFNHPFLNEYHKAQAARNRENL